MKKVLAAIGIVAMLLALFVLDVPALEVSAEQEEQAGLVEKLSFSASGVYTSLESFNATLERTYMSVTSGDPGSVCIMKFQSLDASVISSRYPQNVTSEARYIAIRGSSSMSEIVLTWINGEGSQQKALLSWPAFSSMDYILIDMGSHPGWTGQISQIGFMPGKGDADNLSLTLYWMKFYKENPTDLYADSAVSLQPSVVMPQPTLPPETQEIPESTEQQTDIEVDTAWETLDTQTNAEVWTQQDTIASDDHAGLFFEIFGTPEEMGCQRSMIGCRSGGCTSAASGLILLLLLAAGYVFGRKND